MVYIFAYDYKKVDIEGYEVILLSSERPLKEINNKIKNISNDDLIIMLPKDITPHTDYIEKIVFLYQEQCPVIVFSIDDPEKAFSSQEQNKFISTDAVIFRRGNMRSGLKDISATSNYNKIREKIIRLCGGGTLYAPIDRIEAGKLPVYALTTPSIDSYVTKQPSNLIYKVKINLGIGDLLYSRSILDNLSYKYKKVIISPNIESYNTYREPNKDDLAFTMSMLKMLFKEPYYTIDVPNKNYPPRFAWTFSSIDRVDIVKPNLSDELCEGQPLNIGPYLVIPTRVRELLITEYNTQIKARFLNILKKLSAKYKIVLMGERELLKYKEQVILKDRVYSMYYDIINVIPKDRIVDLTFTTLNAIKGNRIAKIKQECLYMRDAEYNITFGNGGPFCMATAVGKVIGYYSKNNPCDVNPILFKQKNYPGTFIYDNIEAFFLKLNSLLDKKPVFKMKVNMGFGDLLLIRAMMDYTKDRYSKVLISPNTEFFDELRTPAYKKGYIMDYMKLLFSDPYYESHNDLSFQKRNTETLYGGDLIQVVSPQHLQSLICKGKYLNIGPYVTITTKIRALKKSTYEKHKDEFYKVLKDVSMKYKIVILGEQNLPNWPEYNNQTDNIFVIYKDIIDNIPKENIVDLSYTPTTSATLKRLQQDCMYMKDAEYNITLGMGGGFCLTLMAGKVLGFWEEDERPLVTELYHRWCKVKSNAYLTIDFDKFIYWLSELGKMDKNPILKLKSYMGIGDIVYNKLFLDEIKNKYDKIYISPSQEIIDNYRDGNNVYYKFCASLLSLLFDDTDKYTITDDQDYDHMKELTYVDDLKIIPKNHSLEKYFCNVSDVLPQGLKENNYIVLTTKVRTFDYKKYKSSITSYGFWGILKDLRKKYKIVILGERALADVAEYKQKDVKKNTFCIYDDIIENLGAKYIIDLSISSLDATVPKIENIKHDCYVMNKAKGVICIGTGGNFVISSVVAKKTISFKDDKTTPIMNWLYDTNKEMYKNIVLAKNTKEYLNEIIDI